jgi:ABC-2 type transport system ATP-binding protein
MPEQRGLYPRMRVLEQLSYFAQQHGMHGRDANAASMRWLERMGLADRAKSKLEELSHGNQQRVQLSTALVHDPELLILDEPMSGLDPVGSDAMREVLLDLRRQGRTLVLSSHQMETVERLCDSIALINRGEKLLDGPVGEAKRRYGKNTVVLAFEGDGSFLARLPGVERVSDFGQYVEVRLVEKGDPQEVLRQAAARLRVSRFEIMEPSLHDIFVERVTAHGPGAAA